jgi:hypothetical protein
MIYDFSDKQQFTSLDKLPDHRSDAEQQNSLLSIFNHDNPDIAYAERLAYEWINISGAWLTVFKRTQNRGNKDEVWDEDADPTYYKGVKLKGYFIPQPAENALTRWGVDTPNQTTIHFSRANILHIFGEKMITDGDVIVIPHNTLTVTQNNDLRSGIGNRMDRYRVIKASDTGNSRYRWIYWTVQAEVILGDKSINVEFPTTS